MGMKQLHPGAKWLFRITGFFSLLFMFIFFGMFFGVFLSAVLLAAGLTTVFALFFFGGILLFIILFCLVEVYARLSYNYWKYEFLGDQLRIERGIIWKRYSNIPYQRMQNIDITRGVIARICGFSTVNIQTAGYSMPVNARGYGMASEGYIPAVSVDEAEKIREFVIKKITKKKGQGL